MRIISGKYKGKKLKSSKDLQIRPTTDRVKEFIFNVLQDFPRGAVVADIFSGSGSLGLEALSRGAEKVYFVDHSRSSLKILKENIERLQIPDKYYAIVFKDAMQFARDNRSPVALFLIDPPFIYPQIQILLETIVQGNAMSDKSLIVIEHEISNPVEVTSTSYEIIKQRRFGRSIISFLIKRGDHAP